MTRGVPEGSNLASWLLGSAEEAVAVIEDGRSFTYGDLRRAVARRAATVRAASHRRVGAHVLIIGESSYAQLVTYLAVFHAGAVAIPLAGSTTALEAVQGETGATIAFASSEALARAEGCVQHTYPLEIDERLQSDEEQPLEPPVSIDGSALALVLYTSGSTARPRGVMLSADNIRANALAISQATGLSSADRAYVTLPPYYSFGASVLHTHLRVGGSLVLARVVDPARLFDGLVRSGATGLPGVPTLFQILLRRTELAKRPPTGLRYVMCAGGRLDDAVIRELRVLLPSAKVFIRYGATEVTAAASILQPERLDDRLGSVGKGLEGYPLAVLREDGTPIEPGSDEVGEVVVRGPHVALGYFRTDGEDAERSFRGGAFHTGDVARVDADGFVFIVGRAKEFVKTAGHRVSPQEVEALMSAIESIEAVLVYGVPHPIRGEALEALVVSKEAEPSAAAVVAECTKRLPAHMVPTKIRFAAQLPRNANGKVDRRRAAASRANGNV